MNDLTPKQEKFAQEVASGKSQAQAYRVAYDAGNMKDESIWRKASELMESGKVTARVEEIRKPIVEKVKLTLEQHLMDLLRLREEAVKDSKWSAAIAAEIGRGKAAGLYTEKDDLNMDKNITVEIVDFSNIPSC